MRQVACAMALFTAILIIFVLIRRIKGRSLNVSRLAWNWLTGTNVLFYLGMELMMAAKALSCPKTLPCVEAMLFVSLRYPWAILRNMSVSARLSDE